MSLPLRVLGDRVLIKPDIDTNAVEKTESGIYVAESLAAAVEGQDAAASYVSGVIVAIGNQDQPFDTRPYVLRRLRGSGGHLNRGQLATLLADIEALPTHKPCDLAVGDHVTFSWKSGQEVDVDGETYVVMKEQDILAVLETA